MKPHLTGKGGVLADLGGENSQDGLLLAAHTDTLGGMVSQIKGTGRLTITPLGGLNPNNAEAENVRVYTRDGKVLEGTFQLCNPSVHVNGAYSTTARSFDVMEVVLDEATASCIYTQKGNKKIRKPQAANQTALIFDRRAAARLLSINSIRRLCWS